MIQKEGYNVAKLSATSSLDGYDKEIGTIRLREISNQSLIAMAIPNSRLTTSVTRELTNHILLQHLTLQPYDFTSVFEFAISSLT